MDWVAAVLGISGMFILGHNKHWVGFVVSTMSSCVWFYIGMTHSLPGLVFSASGFILAQAWGVYKWRKDDSRY
jgi:hypothetical protein